MYEIFEHTADLGLRIKAPDLDSLFAEAGRALFSVIVENLAEVRPEKEIHIRVEGKQIDYLMLDWLDELIYTFESKLLLLSDFAVSVGPDGIKGCGLEATAWGETFDPDRHRLENEVKAITYHGLLVEQKEAGWTAEVIVDI